MYSVALEKLPPPMSTVAGLCSQHSHNQRGLHTQGRMLLVMTAAPVPGRGEREGVLNFFTADRAQQNQPAQGLACIHVKEEQGFTPQACWLGLSCSTGTSEQAVWHSCTQHDAECLVIIATMVRYTEEALRWRG